MNRLLVLPVLVPMATAVFTLFFMRLARVQRVIAVLGSFFQLGTAAGLLYVVAENGPRSTQLGAWPAPFGITFVVDLFSALMIFLSGLLAFVTAIYSLADINDERRQHGFYPLTQVLLMGMNGVFVTGDLFNMYVWFEVTLMASFVLLVLGNERMQMQNAIKYVAMNLISSALFLTGVGVLHGSVHALSLADLALQLPHISRPIRLTLAMIFLVAFGIKAAVFPLFFWLPDTYPTPPVTIAALFAGLLTKVGVYALIRIFTLIFRSDAESMHPLLLGIAAFTMAVGVFGAVSQNEMRRILAFHSVSQVGYMVMGLAFFTLHSLTGAVFFVVHHSVIKANLFLISGIMQSNGKDVRLELHGGHMLRHPQLAACFFLTAASLAGLPPFSGFWAKLILVQSGLALKAQGATIVVITSLAVGLVTLISMMKIWNEAYWKPAPEAAQDLHTNLQTNSQPRRVYLYASVLMLTGVGLLLGLVPDPLLRLVQKSAKQLEDPALYIHTVLGQGAR